MLNVDISKRLGISKRSVNNNLSKYNFAYKRDSIRVENNMLKGAINDLVRFKRKTYGESFVSKTKEFASKIWQSLLKLVRTIKDFISSVINKFKDKDRLIGKLARVLVETSRKIDESDTTEITAPGDWFKYILEQAQTMQLDGMELDDIPKPIMELFQSIVENDGKIKVFAIDTTGVSPIDGKKQYKRDRELMSAAKVLIEECEEKIAMLEDDALVKSLEKYKSVSKNYKDIIDGKENISLKVLKERMYQNGKDIQKIYSTIIYTDFSIKNLNEMLFYIEKWAKRRVENKDIVGDDEYDHKITEFAGRCQNFTSKQLKKVSEVTRVTNELTNQLINYANILLRLAKPYVKRKGKVKETNEESK